MLGWPWLESVLEADQYYSILCCFFLFLLCLLWCYEPTHVPHRLMVKSALRCRAKFSWDCLAAAARRLAHLLGPIYLQAQKCKALQCQDGNTWPISLHWALMRASLAQHHWLAWYCSGGLLRHLVVAMILFVGCNLTIDLIHSSTMFDF